MILYRPINSQRDEQNSTGMFEFLCLFCFVPSSRLGCSNVVEIKVVCSSQIQLVVMCISPKIHLVAKCVFLKSSWSMSVCSSSPSDRREYFCFFSLLYTNPVCMGFFQWCKMDCIYVALFLSYWPLKALYTTGFFSSIIGSNPDLPISGKPALMPELQLPQKNKKQEKPTYDSLSFHIGIQPLIQKEKH